MTGRRSATATDRADPTLWPTVAWPALSGEQQKIFRAREEAVRLYCRRAPLRSIEAATGVPFSSVRRMYERCLQTHADGRLHGLRALVPYEHVKSYRRSAKSVRSGPAGKAGAFQQLLERHPELEALIANELQAHHVVLREGPKGLVVGGLSALHKRFRLLCLELGLTQGDYPLVQDEQGIRSLGAAVKSMAARSFELAARAALAQKRSGGALSRHPQRGRRRDLPQELRRARVPGRQRLEFHALLLSLRFRSGHAPGNERRLCVGCLFPGPPACRPGRRSRNPDGIFSRAVE